MWSALSVAVTQRLRLDIEQSAKRTLSRFEVFIFFSFVNCSSVSPQLEQTVTKLQLAAGYTQDQISAMPPPLLKIRELEQENGRLQKENEELRRLLTDSTSSSHSRFSSETLRRPSLSQYTDFRSDRDYKRRKALHQEDLYLVCR